MSETIATACGCLYAKDDVNRKIAGCRVHPMAPGSAPATISTTPSTDSVDRDTMKFGCGCIAEWRGGNWQKTTLCAKHAPTPESK
jgi:hypothetical protein